MLRLFYRPLAVADLDSVYAFIERDDPIRAYEFVEEIRTRCAALQSHPAIVPARPKLGDGVRIFPLSGNVVVAYRVDGDEIFILRILYGGRDLETALLAE